MIMVMETCSHVIILIMNFLAIDYGNDNKHSIITPTLILVLIIIPYISYIEIFYYILNNITSPNLIVAEYAIMINI